MSTVDTAVKCAQVAQQPPLSVQAPTQPTHGTGSTSDEVSTDIDDDAGRSDDASDDKLLITHPDFAGMVKLNRSKYIKCDGFTIASRKKCANRKRVTVGDSASVSTVKGVAKKAVPHVHLRKVYDAGIWPVGVVVRLWIFKTNAAVDGTSTSN